jgi:hypothetical protein
MSRQERHDRKTERTFSGEEAATRVLHVLNIAFSSDDWAQSSEGEETRERVLSVIACIRMLMERIDQTAGWPMNPEEMPSDLWDAFNDLNGMLGRYTSTPMFFPLKSTASGWEVSDVRVPDRPAQESHAVRAVIELAKQNKLQRLRSCDCGRWYFVKFSHQRFCSAECRIKFWESSEERKVQKRERARDNYVYKKVHQGK